jgi:hypothetical protein
MSAQKSSPVAPDRKFNSRDAAAPIGPDHPKPHSTPKQHLVEQNVKIYLDAVKSAPRPSKPPAHQADPEQPPVALALPPPLSPSELPPEGKPNSKWGRGQSRSRRFRSQQPGIIRTGPLRGLPKRVLTDKRRALDLEQVRNVTNGAAFAEAQGRPLVVELTLAWRLMGGFSEEDWPAIQVRVFDYMSKWLWRRKVIPTFVWIRERVPGRGIHTHVLLHLPHRDTAKLAEELRDYLSETFGFQDRTTGKIERGVDASYGIFGAWTREMRAGKLLYCLKGFDHRAFRYVSQDGTTENAGAALGIDHRGQQGRIDVKRELWPNLGDGGLRKAAFRGGWKPA